MEWMEIPNPTAAIKIDTPQYPGSSTDCLCQQLRRYMEQVDELQKVDVRQALEVCTEALTLARQPETEGNGVCIEGLADCLFHLAMLHARSGNYLKTISVIFEALPIIETCNNRFLLARSINVMGVANGNLGNYYEAVNDLMKALKIFQELGDRTWEAGVLNNIGNQYWQLHNFEWALKYLSMSLALAESTDDKSLQGDICETMCGIYLDQKDYTTALDFGSRCLALYEETGNRHAEAEVLNSIGDVYQAQNQLFKSLESYQRALRLAQETGHNHEEVETLLRIGRHLTALGQYAQAEENLYRALEIAVRLEIKHIIYECHEALMRLYKANGNYQIALQHAEQSFHFYQQVYDEDQANRIQSLEVMHQVETAQKDAEIYRLQNAVLQDEIDHRIKAQAALHELATTDALTELFNRRHFFEVAGMRFQRAEAENLPLAVILIDVDNFKNVNDRYGHSAGDQVLKELARTMRAGVRKIDVVARYGGEEFVILLPDTEAAAAMIIAERLRKMVDQQTTEVDGQQIHISISSGIALYNGNKQINLEFNLERMLNGADMAMYEAKQAGGNRVHVWEHKNPAG